MTLNQQNAQLVP